MNLLSGLANLLGFGGAQAPNTSSTLDPNQPPTTTVTLTPEARAAQAETTTRTDGVNLAAATTPAAAQAPTTPINHEAVVKQATAVFEAAKLDYEKAVEAVKANAEATLKVKIEALETAAKALQKAIEDQKAAAQTQATTTIQPAVAQAVAPQAAPSNTTVTGAPNSPMTINMGAAGPSGANTQTTTAPAIPSSEPMKPEDAAALLQQLMTAQQEQAAVPATK